MHALHATKYHISILILINPYSIYIPHPFPSTPQNNTPHTTHQTQNTTHNTQNPSHPPHITPPTHTHTHTHQHTHTHTQAEAYTAAERRILECVTPHPSQLDYRASIMTLIKVSVCVSVLICIFFSVLFCPSLIFSYHLFSSLLFSPSLLLS
jgi:hypothetical protein